MSNSLTVNTPRPLLTVNSSTPVLTVRSGTTVLRIGPDPAPPPLPTYPVQSGRLDGAFVSFPGLTDAELGPTFAELAASGMTLVILTATRLKTGGCNTGAGASYAWQTGMPSRLGTILDAAQANAIAVYVGLIESSYTCASAHVDPNRTQDATDAGSTVGTLVASYGTHPALAGWYLTNEADIAAQGSAYVLEQTNLYYAAQVDAIRTHSSLPIIVAPYLRGGVTTEPATVGQRALALQDATGGELIQCWQDSAGSGVAIDEWTRTPAEFTVGQFFDAVNIAIGPERFWSDNELFTAGALYTSAPTSRLKQQLEASRATSKHLSWLPQTHLGTTDDTRAPEATRALAVYRARFGVAGSMASPVAYQWNTARDAARPDKGNAPFDGTPGDWKASDDDNWVGFAAGAAAEIQIDLGTTRTLAWVGMQVLNRNAAGITFPDTLTLTTSTDGTTWTTGTTWTITTAKVDDELVIGNPAAVSIACRYIRLRTTNTGKTRIGEIDLVTSGG